MNATLSEVAMPSRPLDLKHRVDTVIQTNPYLSRQKLHFETLNGHVILRGMVRTYFEKQMAQEAVRRVDGVTGIDNELEVSWA